MKPDVERLLRIVAPALLFVSGCDEGAPQSREPVQTRSEPAKADAEQTGAKPEAPEVAVKKPEAPEVAVKKPETPEVAVKKPETPEVAVKKPEAPEVAVKKPETPKVAVTKPETPQVAKPMPKPRSGPTCPSGSWCTDKKTAKSLFQGKGQEMGCASKVALKPGVPVPPRFPTNISGFDAASTKAKRKAGDAEACCYAWHERCPGGRPLLDETDEPVTAAFRPGSRWAGAAFCEQGSGAARAEAARGWLADAAMEHASVASFGRVALELLALGAPPELIEGAHLAAIDEIRHARVCLGLAVACGAKRMEPGALAAVPQRPAELARFAVDTFIEGCVGESTAALAVTRAAAGVEDEAIRQALAEIAEDEGRHAALAWRMVAWAVAAGGDAVRCALQAEAARQRRTVPVVSAGGETDAALRALGRLDARAQRSARADAWTGVVEPMLAALLTPRAQGEGPARA